ncbi:MAG: DUF561 domain-containing protein [Oscillatoriales cyanobacterium SM2_1_8]|nr:DUF561 domain-containing protein [Oscillatoriales cyanobacterium SM2_1_8]
MSMFHRLPAPLHRAFAEGRALKIISGLQNFDLDSVGRVVRAAQAGGATYVDIAADPRLVALAKRETHLPVCVSAVVPTQLAQAVAAGADLVEIGNYDSFYGEGRVFSAETVVRLACETRVLLPDTALSVTVPHTLPLDAQVALAEKLVEVGADLIQTEGGTFSQPQHAGTLGAIEKAAPTLAAAREISRAVAIPVLCASGLSDVTVPLAIAAGARGVGVGSAVNKLADEILAIAAVRSLRAALDGVVTRAIA